MAIKLATAKRKNGDELHLKTSLSQVVGLTEALEGKASKDFVNSTVQTMSAAPLAYDASGNPFPTKSALDNATAFYHGGTEKTPDEHDFVTVLADEEHGGAQTRYSYAGGGWTFQYLVNDQPFTAAQNAAINSGITAEKVAKMDDFVTEDVADGKYANKGYIEGLGTVYFVQPGADLSGYKDTDLIIEVEN